MVKAVKELRLPLKLKSNQIEVVEKHGHLFEDEESITDAIILGLSTCKFLWPDAIDLICE